MNDFNVDSVHDQKMIWVERLVCSMKFEEINKNYPLNDDEMKGYIKALDWIMSEWE